MKLIVGATGAYTKIPLIFSGILSVLLINSASSSEWRGISDSEFQERSLKLGSDQANKVHSPELWRAKQKRPSDSLIQASSNHERIFSLGAQLEKDSFLKQGLSKSFKPSNVDKRKSNEQASPEASRSPYVLEIQYDNDDHVRSGFLDLMGAGTRAKEKVPPEVIQVPLAGAAYGHMVPSSSGLRGDVEHRVEFPYARNVTPTSSSASASASNASDIILLVNPPTAEVRTKELGFRGEVQYHPHIAYEPERNVNGSNAENVKASNVDVLKLSLTEKTDASTSTLAPQFSSVPPRVPKKIVTKISPLGNAAADAPGTNAKSRPSAVGGYKRQAERLQVVDLGTLGHDPHMTPHVLLEEMRKLIAAHAPKTDDGRSSLVLFHKNKETMSQGDVETSHVFPSNNDKLRISTKLELPINPNQTTINSPPPVVGKAASSSLLSETIGNSLYVQSVTPSSALGKPNQDLGKDIVAANAAKTNGLESPRASDDVKMPVQVKFHDKLIPVTAFIDPKTAPLPGVHFLLNPWVYKFPPWFEPHNPPPPGATTNSTDLLQGDIILDLEGIQEAENGDELVNVRVPSFSRFKDEVIRTILEANLKDRTRRGKSIDHKLGGEVGGNSLQSEVTSETHPKKVVSVIGDSEMNVKLAAIEQSIDHDLNSDKQLDFNSGESHGAAYDEKHSAYDSEEQDTGISHNGNGANHHGLKSFGDAASYEDNSSYNSYYDGNKSPGKYSETSDFSFGDHPYLGHKNSDIPGSYHDVTPYGGGGGPFFDGGDVGSGEKYFGDFHQSGEEDFEGADEYNGYSSAPVYGTPHYHIQTPYNVGYSGSNEETDSYENSEYNTSGEKDSNYETGSNNDEYFRDHKVGAKEPVYTSYNSGDDSEAPDHYGSSRPSPHYGTVDSSFYHRPPNSNHNPYNGNEYLDGDTRDQHEGLAAYKNKPSESYGSEESYTHDNDGLGFHSHSPGNYDPPSTGRYRESGDDFGHGGLVKNYNPKTKDHDSPHAGGVTNSNLRPNPGFDESNDSKAGYISGKVIFRGDTSAGEFGRHRPRGSEDHVGASGGQFSPSSGYRHPSLKPFKPSPPDPTSVPFSLLNDQPNVNHSPPSKLLVPNFRRPHDFPNKDKYSSAFVSKPQYLRSIYGPSGNIFSKHGTSQKPLTPSPAFNPNYILTPQKYYYDDHRSHPVMSSGHAVTYWVPSKLNFYQTPNRRHDLGSSSSIPKENVVVGVHPAAREGIKPSQTLVPPPTMRMSERSSRTPHLSQGLDLLPYFNAIHRNKKRKNKLNISIPMSYSGTSLRNVSAIVDESSSNFQKPMSYRKSKEHLSSGISVDIIYGSKKNSGPMSPDIAIKNAGSTQRFSRFTLSEESAHESEKPFFDESSPKSVPNPRSLSSSSVVRRWRQRAGGPNVQKQGVSSSWYWPEGLQI